MPDVPLALTALALTAIADATRRLRDGGNVATWERQMQQVLARAHIAAALAAIQERTGVAPRGLSRAERADVQRIVAQQLDYLRGFVQAVRDGQLSPAQVAARAALYAGATRATCSALRWAGWDLPFHPTEGSECKANCRCAWKVEDQGDGTGLAFWQLGATERHCVTCPSRAASSPYIVTRTL